MVRDLFRIIRFFSIRSIPKTLYFNFKCLPFKQAVMLPVHVHYKTLLKDTSGKVVLNCRPRFGMIGIGFENGYKGVSNRGLWEAGGKIVFNGSANIFPGAKIIATGEVHFGENFSMQTSTIISRKKIVFGNNCLLSWDCLIMDSDQHPVKEIETDQQINPPEEVVLGNNIWMGCRCTVLKGTKIPDDTIIAANSFLNKKYKGQYQVIGGNPARILKQNVTWSYE